MRTPSLVTFAARALRLGDFFLYFVQICPWGPRLVAAAAAGVAAAE